MYLVIITTNIGSHVYGKYAREERAQVTAAGLRTVYADATISVVREVPHVRMI